MTVFRIEIHTMGKVCVLACAHYGTNRSKSEDSAERSRLRQLAAPRLYKY